MAEHAFYFYTPDLLFKLDTSRGEVDSDVESRANVWAIAFRDLIRNGDGKSYPFNKALPARYKVSDICKFSNGTRSGYAFIVRDTTAGCEWLFLFSGYDSSSNVPAANYFIIPGSTSSYPYFQNCAIEPDNTGYITSSGFGLNVMFNPDYASDTFDMKFNDSTELTYTGGDFGTSSALPANSTSKANIFLPNTDYPRGITMIQSGSESVNGSDIFLCFDEDEEALDIMMSQGSSKNPDFICKMGNILDPDDVGDTYTQGMMWIETTATSTQNTSGNPDHDEGYVDCFSSAGSRLYDLELVFRKTLTQDNELTVGSKFKWYPVEVSNGGAMKGHLKGNLGREASAYNAREYYLQLFAEDPASPTITFMKVTDALLMKYPNGVPPFPFTFPTKK